MLYHLVIIGNKSQLLLFIHCTIFKSMNYSKLCTNILKLFQSLGIYWFVNRRNEENDEKPLRIQIPVNTYCRIMTRTTKKTQQNDVRACLQQEAIWLMCTGNISSELSLERREQPAKIRKEH